MPLTSSNHSVPQNGTPHIHTQNSDAHQNITLEELYEAPLFKDIEQQVVDTFLRSGSRFIYGSGTPIIIVNDTGETFFLILGGVAKITLLNDKNDAVNVTLFKAGDFFGELSLLESRPTRTANVIAATDVEVLAIQRPEFMRMMRQHP